MLTLRYTYHAFAVTINLGTEAGSAFQTRNFVEQVKEMHKERDKGFEEEFKFAQGQGHVIQDLSTFETLLLAFSSKHSISATSCSHNDYMLSLQYTIHNPLSTVFSYRSSRACQAIRVAVISIIA